MERRADGALSVCGIVGQFSFGGGRPDAERLIPLVNSIAHRGPDDSTYWHDGPFFFGHRRLAIIDLASGRQPMATEDADLVVTFNGEIYNYIELKAELAACGHVFRTSSDTEVLLHGYRQWGVDLPSRLIGMFAFAIADRRTRELFIARDRFGEKPLLLLDSPKSIAFASELRPLAALVQQRELNDDALPAYLCLNYVPGDETLMKGVRRMRPATWRVYAENGTVREGCYWRPPAPEPSPGGIAEVVERVETLLDRAVRLALRSDVPVGLFLSGGIDSSLIARSAARSGHLERAFCLVFDDSSYSEWPNAMATARHLGIPLTPVKLDASAMSQFIELVSHADDPLADSSALAVWTISREAARHNKVVLSGDGGDELFGGYLTYRATLWHNDTTSRLPAALSRGISRLGRTLWTTERKVSASYKAMRYLRAVHLPSREAHFTWNGAWLPDQAAALLTRPELRAKARDALRDLASVHRLPVRPGVNALQAADVGEYLPNDILTKSDRMSMAHGLEVRSPLLEPGLADFALRLPAALKVTHRGPSKRVLRELARRSYGIDVASARKQGFSIPVHNWLRQPGRTLVEDLLGKRSISSVPQLDAAQVSRLTHDHIVGRRSLGFELWGLCVLVAWHRAYVQALPSAVPAAVPQRVEFRVGAAAHTR
jgi:asparagine synthase (glutamine-hydrolysing)